MHSADAADGSARKRAMTRNRREPFRDVTWYSSARLANQFCPSAQEGQSAQATISILSPSNAHTAPRRSTSNRSSPRLPVVTLTLAVAGTQVAHDCRPSAACRLSTNRPFRIPSPGRGTTRQYARRSSGLRTVACQVWISSSGCGLESSKLRESRHEPLRGREKSGKRQSARPLTLTKQGFSRAGKESNIS